MFFGMRKGELSTKRCRSFTSVGSSQKAITSQENRLNDRRSVGGDLRPHLGALLGDRARDGRALHLALRDDDDAGVVLEVDEDALAAAPAAALADDDRRHHLLTELRIAKE